LRPGALLAIDFLGPGRGAGPKLYFPGSVVNHFRRKLISAHFFEQISIFVELACFAEYSRCSLREVLLELVQNKGSARWTYAGRTHAIIYSSVCLPRVQVPSIV
jgi:hypothetical protein